MADTMSNAPTIAPEESASNIDAKATTAPTKGKAAGKRSSKNTPGKDTPPGAVQVQKPGQSKTGKVTPPQNATIPLTGWADLDICATRVETIPTFTVDVNPYIDLVRTEFDRIASRSPTAGKHIPFALFQYYCLELFWFRALTVFKLNGQTLSTEQKNFLNAFSAAEEFTVPTHIAQYLANLGNFLQGGEAYNFRLIDVQYTGRNADGTVQEGWVDCGNGATRITTGAQFWAYAQLPAPGVFATTVVNETAFNDPANPGFDTLDHVTPAAADNRSWKPTHNIAGWVNDHSHYRQNHQSWRSTYTNLGWTPTSIPTDMQTCFLFSASSMRWMSEKLSTVKELKLHGSKQLTLSVQGSPMQAYWLEEPDVQQSYDDVGYLEDEPRTKATLNTPLALTSRFSVDPKALTPAFDFGYRLARSKVILRYENRKPVFADRSNFQPWIYFDTSDADHPTITDPPPAFLIGMNSSWTYGSAGNINVVRFATPSMRRDLALQSSLLLVDQ